MKLGSHFLRSAAKHLGERYILGALAPKNNARWSGPWDCAEFVSWVVYQVTGQLHGCASNITPPVPMPTRATGRVMRRRPCSASPWPLALRTPGAILNRIPAHGLIGHIAFSDGKGGTIEAHSTKRGVIAGSATGRRWDMGLLLPGVRYTRERRSGTRSACNTAD
ncbi:MAG: hypothetical protein R2811_05720 [Flavobacteriales bacterium]